MDNSWPLVGCQAPDVALVLDIHVKIVGLITVMDDSTPYVIAVEAGIAAVGTENAAVNATANIPMFPTSFVTSVNRSC
jgi:hypothetical protein